MRNLLTIRDESGETLGHALLAGFAALAAIVTVSLLLVVLS